MAMHPAITEEARLLAGFDPPTTDREEGITAVGGRYKTEELESGIVYRWCPLKISLRCHDCGEFWEASANEPACPGCGVDRSDLLKQRELTVGHNENNGHSHPWRHWHRTFGFSLPF